MNESISYAQLMFDEQKFHERLQEVEDEKDQVRSRGDAVEDCSGSDQRQDFLLHREYYSSNVHSTLRSTVTGGLSTSTDNSTAQDEDANT